MMVVDQITLEPYFDKHGVLLVREKGTKRLIEGLQSVSVSNDIESMQEVTIRFVVCIGLFNEQVKDIEAEATSSKA